MLFRSPAPFVSEATVTGAAPDADPVRQVLADEATRGTPGPVVIRSHDLGRIAAGPVELIVRDAAPGTVIDIAAAEHLDGAGSLATLGQHAGLRYVCAGGPEERFASLEAIGTRHLHLSVRTPDGAAAPDIDVAVRDRHRPRPAGADFACSDQIGRAHV